MKTAFFVTLLVTTEAAAAASKKKKTCKKVCQLTKECSKKPHPSLSFCFRNNVDACCMTAHDELIMGNYNAFMPSACSSQFGYFE
jgi:hypothetical protein